VLLLEILLPLQFCLLLSVPLLTGYLGLLPLLLLSQELEMGFALSFLMGSPDLGLPILLKFLLSSLLS